jgi:amino acid transporter/nucleotide-binding universal stress UspA family protein
MDSPSSTTPPGAVNVAEVPPKPEALSLLASERPRNLGWFSAASLLFGDWGTSRLYVLGIAFLVAGRSSFWLIAAMSLLILAVGWAYTEICRLYPNGGGVYTAARRRHELLGVVAALLLFADYTITASLSAFEAFHYFGLGDDKPAMVDPASPTSATAATPEASATPADKPQLHDAGDHIDRHHKAEESGAAAEHPLLKLNSPGLWAIIAIIVIGALNLLGPKHSSRYAVLAALGMVFITLLVTAFAIPQIDWRNLNLGTLNQPPVQMWHAFVAVVLALSGVEAIASMTGVMKEPVYLTARKSIWIVALEVAIFNIILAIAMCAASQALPTVLDRQNHAEDMLAFLASYYVGPAGEWPVRILGGILLLSATNTAVGALSGTMYVMSRDGELPGVLQKLNSFGTPWLCTLIAAGVPALVLVFVHDLNSLAALYAVGIVGAVAIDAILCAIHPRLRRWYRKVPMFILGILLKLIWLTLAWDKRSALIFVSIVMVVGFGLRFLTRFLARRRAKPSLLRQAIMNQLTPEALSKPRMLVATAGGAQLADQVCARAKAEDAALVVAFVREVALNYKVESTGKMTLDTDPAAQALYVDYLEAGHKAGVPIIPAYDSGHDAAEVIAELAALNGVTRLIMGTSRRGALHQLIKGSFQQKLESLLPSEIPVEVLSPAPTVAVAH